MWNAAFSESTRFFAQTTDELGISDETVAEIHSKVAAIDGSAHQEAVLYCLGEYVDAELDYQGAGDRGLGRLSAVIPRYGAYFRRHLAHLPREKLSELRQLMMNQVVGGYLAHVVLAEAPLLKPTTSGPEELFRAWVPVVYSSALHNSFSMDTWTAMARLVSPATARHKEELLRRGITGGGLFKRDRTDQILQYYPIAGFALRAMETRRLEG